MEKNRINTFNNNAIIGVKMKIVNQQLIHGFFIRQNCLYNHRMDQLYVNYTNRTVKSHATDYVVCYTFMSRIKSWFIPVKFILQNFISEIIMPLYNWMMTLCACVDSYMILTASLKLQLIFLLWSYIHQGIFNALLY